MRSALALWLAIVLPVAIAAALHGATQHLLGDAGGEVRSFSSAQRIDGAGLQPPAEGGTTVNLPFFVPRVPGTPSGPMWFKVAFEMEEDADVPWQVAVSFRPTLLLYLDGQLLAQSAHGDALDRGEGNFQVGDRSLQVAVPASLLHAGRHELQLRVGSAGYDGTSLSALRLGQAEAMHARDASREFMQWLRAGISAASAVLGGFLVLAWVSMRREWLYGLAGVHCLLIALLLASGAMSEPPLPAPWWRVALDAADVAAKGLMLLLVVGLFEAPRPRVVGWILAYVAVGGCIDALAAWRHLAWTDFGHPWPWWAIGSRAAVLGAATAFACRAAWRDGSWPRIGAAVVVGLGAWLWLYVTFFVIVFDTRVRVADLNFVGYGAWVFMIGLLLQRRYVASLRRDERVREELEGLVARRTTQLEANFARLRESERLRMAAAERERLLQEMHDGLGAQLLAAKMSAQRGTLSREEVVQTFEDCIREMRLTVDTLSVEGGDLGLLLANLRHRLGARLRDAGLELDWSVGDTPPVPALEGTGGRELGRIVQEALNNVIQHAGATRIRIATRPEGPATVLLAIADNGRGLAADRSEGRGMGNIRARAARLGARVDWTDIDYAADGGGGTELRLYLPLARPSGPPVAPAGSMV